MMTECTVVEIVNKESGEVVRSIPCPSESQALRVYQGASINLNKKTHLVRMVEEKVTG
jgi:uncharacterized FlaG/YvyC family protein